MLPADWKPTELPDMENLIILGRKGEVKLVEHVVQFGINIDDETIRKVIEEKALDQVCDQIRKDIEKDLPKKYTYNRGNETDWKEVAKDAVSNIIAEHKDEIIEKAIDSIARSIRSSKKFREEYGAMIDDFKEE